LVAGGKGKEKARQAVGVMACGVIFAEQCGTDGLDAQGPDLFQVSGDRPGASGGVSPQQALPQRLAIQHDVVEKSLPPMRVQGAEVVGGGVAA
jgi:hypothetical protein